MAVTLKEFWKSVNIWHWSIYK